MSIPTPIRTLITGATGMVGSHAVRAFLREGHHVRAFVRSPEKARRVLGEVTGSLEVAEGDIGDARSVDSALDGCDAVVHCAAMVAVGSGKDPQALIETNVGGARNVIGVACERGVERIVHLSSIAPLFRRDGAPVTASAGLQPSKHAYGQSKMMAEAYVRELQAAGHPVKIIYPGAVIGPDDPGLTDSMRSVQLFAQKFLPITATGIQYVDVRDIALGLVRMIEDTPGPVRYLAAGNFITWPDLATLLEQVLGERPPAHRVPAPLFRLAGRLADAVRLVVPIEFPLSVESAAYVTRWNPIENSNELQRLGVEFRPINESITDTIQWMQSTGHIGTR